MTNDNTTQVLNLYAKKLHISVTSQSIDDELQKHPEYASLLAFSDVLDRFHVPNAAYRLEFDQLTQVPLPFIAYINRKDFVVITQFNYKHVTLSNERWKNKTLTRDEFKKMYTGSVLIAEKHEDSGEANYEKKHRKEQLESLRMPVILAGTITILLTFLSLHTQYINTLSVQIGLLTLFKTAGLVTSVLLLTQSIDTKNPLIQKLCSSDNSKDCNAILSSKAAKINDVLSWSEMGFFYLRVVGWCYCLIVGMVLLYSRWH
jgi:ABC-type bacteriocin/lantibiotic exporter with double-glycine peptidase domain